VRCEQAAGEFVQRAGFLGRHRHQLDPPAVVTAALDALTAGRTLMVPGWRNRLTARAVTLLPRRLVLHAAERATRRVITA
jgi:short-subunit dehydrogenase